MAETQGASWTAIHGSFACLKRGPEGALYAVTGRGKVFCFRPRMGAVDFVVNLAEADGAKPSDRGPFVDLEIGTDGTIYALTSDGLVYWLSPGTRTMGRTTIDFKEATRDPLTSRPRLVP